MQVFVQLKHELQCIHGFGNYNTAIDFICLPAAWVYWSLKFPPRDLTVIGILCLQLHTATVERYSVECQAAGGPLRSMVSEMEKQSSTEWNDHTVIWEISLGQSNEHCSSCLGKEKWWDALPWVDSKALPINKNTTLKVVTKRSEWKHIPVI